MLDVEIRHNLTIILGIEETKPLHEDQRYDLSILCVCVFSKLELF